MYGVFVYWNDSPNRAERLSNGCTTTRIVHAAAFTTPERARTAGEQALTDVPGVDRWEVRPFHGKGVVQEVQR